MAILVLLNTPSGVLRPITDWPLVAGDAEGPNATPAHAPSRALADCVPFTDVYAAGSPYRNAVGCRRSSG